MRADVNRRFGAAEFLRQGGYSGAAFPAGL